jgi:large conductance mechanosensitive channel
VRAHFTAGQAFTSLVSDVLTPLIGALGGAPDFSAIKLGPIALGKFINALANFLVVAAAIYFLVVMPMNELAKRRKKEEAPAAPPEPPEEVKLLREILEELRKKA